MTYLDRILRPVTLGASVLLAALTLAACGNSTGTGTGTVAASGPTDSSASSTGSDLTASSSPPTSSGTTAAATATGSVGAAAPGATTAARAGIAQCGTAGLSVALGRSDAAMSHAARVVVLTNTSGRTCAMEGYGGYGLYVQGSSTLVQNVTRGAGYFGNDPGPTRLLLKPGGHAYAMIGWTTPTAGTSCVQAVRLAVTPPNQTVSLKVAFSAGVCSNGHLNSTAWSARSPI